MKGWIVIVFFVVCCACGFAQDEKNRPGIIPHHAKIQYAGSIGFISAGVGYELAKKKLQGDLLYGYLPASVGGITIHSVTAKLTWLPVSKQLKNDMKWDCLTAGLLVNYAFGRQYHLFSRTRYSFVYYGFPTAAHINLFIGSAITKNRIGLYYEFGATDRDMISFAKNPKAISFFDIVNFGAGVRLSFK